MKTTTVIKILSELESEAIGFAKRCSHARKLLERVEGSSPAPERVEKIDKASVIKMNSDRRKRMMK